MELRRSWRKLPKLFKLFNPFLEKFGGTDPANFRGVRMDDIAALEDIVRADIFL